MSILIGNIQKRIGLSLSGGGFRAAAFHLGVMRKLHKLALLDRIDLISCVSGGSIAGAFLALNWKSPSVLNELENYLLTRSIAVSSVIGGILDPFESRIDKLANSYDDDLFKGATLSNLKSGPRIYLNATNLSTGNMFFFVAGGAGPSEIGEHELGVVSGENFGVARAVAASSAFPPVFPPLKLSAKEYPPGVSFDYVTLTDGGIYDNMGINPALRERNDINYLIVSDGGKPFANDSNPTESGALVLKAELDIMMEQIRGLEFDRLEHRHKAQSGPAPLWFSIDSINGEEREGDAAMASSISTNLAALKKPQLDVLVRHGSSLVEARIRKYAPELIA
jgi:NTE family protein